MIKRILSLVSNMPLIILNITSFVEFLMNRLLEDHQTCKIPESCLLEHLFNCLDLVTLKNVSFYFSFLNIIVSCCFPKIMLPNDNQLRYECIFHFYFGRTKIYFTFEKIC